MALRINAAFKPELSMGSVIQSILKSHSLPCGLDDGGCGVQNVISIVLKTPPLVFTLELVWASEHTQRDEIQVSVFFLTTWCDMVCRAETMQIMY